METTTDTTKTTQSTAITPESLQTPKVDLSKTIQTFTSPIVTQPNVADTIIANTTIPETQNQKTASDLSTAISGLIPKLQGETQALSTEETNAGLPKLNQDLNAINSQIIQKQAEINQDDIKLVAAMRNEERRDTLLPFAQIGQAKLAGDAAIYRGLKNAEIGVLNAQAIAKQGDITLAKDTARRAVDLKYAPYKDQIAVYKSQLEAIQPLLTADEKKQARVQEIKTNLALKEIEKVSNFQKTALENAISNNAPQSVLNAINKATTIDEITKVGSNYLISASDKLDKALKNAMIAEKNSKVTTYTPKQVESAGYADRIAQSNSIIDSNLDTFKKMNYLQFKAAESTSGLANKYLSPEQRQVALAMRNFITAKLRKESGAAISPSEFDDARAQYFPNLGDDQATLNIKKQLRDSVLSNLEQEAGGAYIKNTVGSYLDNVDKSLSKSVSMYDYLSSLPKTK